MTLRTKLLLTQLPLALALVILGLVSYQTAQSLGRRSQAILEDNYRSAQAAQRMKEYAERMDSAALFLLSGAEAEGRAQIETYRPRFEDELRVQEGNITERGERDATRRLQAAWSAYVHDLDTLAAVPARERKAFYFTRLQRAFLAVKNEADAILEINQAAMREKSDVARVEANRATLLLVGVSLAALVIGMLLAVTLSRQFLGEMLHAQQTTQAAIDSLPDPILVYDAGGALVSYNAAAGAVMAGGALRSDAGVHEALDKVRRQITEQGVPYQPRGYEETFRMSTADGERYFLLRGSPMRGAGQAVRGVTLVLQDVTRLRVIDELKNDLVATVAHEMKTPLTSLTMAIHLCLAQGIGPLTARQEEMLAAAREDCRRLQAIVDELLDLARIQSGRLQLRLEPVPVRDIVARALEVHQAAIAEKALAVSADLSGAWSVWADQDRIKLAIGNLLANAVKYSPAGGVVGVAVRPMGNEIEISVSDRGPGVPQAQRERVFDKFFRGESGAGGAGLGLYIAREIVRAHGGRIGVEACNPEGSRFWFSLPKA